VVGRRRRKHVGKYYGHVEQLLGASHNPLKEAIIEGRKRESLSGHVARIREKYAHIIHTNFGIVLGLLRSEASSSSLPSLSLSSKLSFVLNFQ
jgi:hypothetical protein